jgi:hypothetical protein
MSKQDYDIAFSLDVIKGSRNYTLRRLESEMNIRKQHSVSS